MVEWLQFVSALVVAVPIGYTVVFLFLYLFFGRNTPKTKIFEVEVDYDKPLSAIIRELDLRWNAVFGSAEYNVAREAIDWDRMYDDAQSSRNSYLGNAGGYNRKGKRSVTVTLFSFPRDVLTRQVKARFQKRGLRAANPKELLALVGVVEVPEEMSDFPRSQMPVVALQDVERFGAGAFGTDVSMLAIHFFALSLKSAMSLMSASKGYTETLWKRGVVFAAVEAEPGEEGTAV